MINNDIKNQKAGDYSTNFQAQNITLVNQQVIPVEYISTICEKIVENNMLKYTIDAEEKAIQRFNKFKNLYIGEVSKQKKEIIEELTEKFKEPSMQDAFFQAQKGYTKYGNEEKAEKLVQLLIEKGKQEMGSLKDILIDDAIDKLSKMTINQLNILSYLNAINLSYPSDSLEHFHKNYINKSLQFYFSINQERLDGDIQYLMQLGCIRQFSIAQGSNKIINHIKESYGGLFAAGFTKQEFESLYGVESEGIIMHCLTDSKLWQVVALNHTELNKMYLNMNANQQQQDIINKFYERILPDERIREIILQLEPRMNVLLENNKIHNYNLMPLGTLIGIKNYETMFNEEINWEV